MVIRRSGMLGTDGCDIKINNYGNESNYGIVYCITDEQYYIYNINITHFFILFTWINRIF